MSRRVAIIGAGPSGLPAIRHALLHDFQPICFEMTNDIGGLWKYKADKGEDASVMKSTIINSSKEMSAYSDFPPRKEFPNFMHNTRMLEYFREYAAAFNLLPHIRFNHKVINIKRSNTFDTHGTWIVQYEHSGLKEEEIFHAVLVCSGHHKTPHLPPKWKGQDNYKGTIVHSHEYKTPDGYEDRKVLCLGVGNSGLDIAVELSRVAKQVFLSTRRGAWIFHRISDNGRPVDLVLGSRMRRSFLNMLPPKITAKIVENILNSRFDHEAYGIKPDFSPSATHISINDELPNRIASGTIQIVTDIEEFTENGVRFKDGRKEEIEKVVLSTGYSITFPFLENGQLIKVENNWVRLYKNMFPLELSSHNTLAVIGLIQPLGSIMPISEMQARLFFGQLTKLCTLPNKEQMEADIQRKEQMIKQRFIPSPRHTIQVDYTPFMDELAEIIGCKPDYWKLVCNDPILAYHSFTAPNVSYNYRINGPHSSPSARQSILSIDQRTGFTKVHAANTVSLITKSAIFFLLFLLIINGLF